MDGRLFVHERTGQRELVGAGFNGWCFVFGWIYALVTRQWFVFWVLLGRSLCAWFFLGVGLPPLLLLLVSFGVQLFVAFRCNEWRVETLIERGYEET